MMRAFTFRETGLDRNALLRDFAPAGLIVVFALVVSQALPVDPDSGLRPLASSEIIIVGTLAASIWILYRRLRRLRRRVLAVAADAVRVYPPRGLLALPDAAGAPALEIRRADVDRVRVARLDTAAGRFVRRNVIGMLPECCEVIAGTRRHRFDDLTWHPDIDTLARLQGGAGPDARRRRREARASALRTAFETAGYPVERN